jgi:hypothetical protein
VIKHDNHVTVLSYTDATGFIYYYDLREIGWGCMELIDLAQDRNQLRPVLNTVMKLRVP